MKKGLEQVFIYGLYEFLKCSLTAKIKGGTHGAAIPYIVMNDLTSFEIQFSKEILVLYSNRVKTILGDIIKLSSQLHLLTEARDRLLPKLMSGEIEV